MPSRLSIFRPINARKLLAIRVLGQSGDGLLQTALATFMLFSPERQSSPMRVAMVFMISLLPYSIIGPFIGVFIDRWPRRNILAATNLLRVLVMLCIAGLVWGHQATVWLACLTLITLGINRFIQATLSASLVHVVDADNLSRANSLFPTLGTVSATLAAGVGLTIQKFYSNNDHTNAVIVLIGAAFAFTASATAGSMRPHLLLGPDLIDSSLRAELRNAYVGFISGVRVLHKVPHVRRLLYASAMQRSAFGALTISALLLARTVWHDQSQLSASLHDFGILVGCAALGAFAAALTCASIAHRISLTKFAMLTLLGAAVVVFFGLAVHHLITIALSAFMLSYAGQVAKIVADTTVQLHIDDAHRGRVFTFFDMLINVGIVIGVSVVAVIEPLRTQPVLGGALISLVVLIAVGLTRSTVTAKIPTSALDAKPTTDEVPQ